MSAERTAIDGPDLAAVVTAVVAAIESSFEAAHRSTQLPTER